MRLPHEGPHGVQVPRVRHAPKVRRSSWEDVADVAKAYGMVLDPWQENVLQAAMGERFDGQWATPRVGLSVPRQNGKGAILEARELAGLLVFNEQLIVHSAHEQKTARVGFDRIRAYFDNYDDLRKRVRQIGTAVAREYIELTSGQKLLFPARSKGALRGFSADCLILDEGQILSDTAWQAIQPTISARPNPQSWLVGTPPTPADDGAVFERWRRGGLEGKDHRLCWCEWSVAADAPLDDVAVWAQANPALGYRISLEAIQDERESMDDDGFARERLGMWDEASSGRVIDIDSWAACAVPPSDQIVGEITLAVDVSPAMDAGSVALAGVRADGRLQVEVVTNRTSTGWIAERVAQIVARQKVRAVVIDGGSTAAALIDPLKAKGVTVTVTGARHMAQAFSIFYLSVMEQDMCHLDDPVLNTALSVARKRSIGDGFGWHRKNSAADITPLVACTLALWGGSSDDVVKAKTPSPSYGF